MAWEKVPPLAVMQRLFVDRWWANGGNVIEAVEFAGYELPNPSARASKGRHLLASKPVRAYLDYLRQKDKQERIMREEQAAKIAARAAVEAAREGEIKKLADMVTVPHESLTEENGDLGAVSAAVVGATAQQAQPQKNADNCIYGPICDDGEDLETADMQASSSIVDESGRGRLHVVQHTTSGAGMLLPPTQIIPADGETKYGAELTPTEVREILANIARGNENGMRDARVRMKAIELAMRNLGMLVDLSVKASVDGREARKALTKEERDAEVKRLEGYIAKVKKTRLSE